MTCPAHTLYACLPCSTHQAPQLSGVAHLVTVSGQSSPGGEGGERELVTKVPVRLEQLLVLKPGHGGSVSARTAFLGTAVLPSLQP